MVKAAGRHEIKARLRLGSRYAKKGVKSGFFHILGGNTLVKVISALSVMLYPRIMGADYSTFKLADNLLGYMLIAGGLGMSNVILRYCAAFDTPREQKAYFTFAVKFGLISNLVLIGVFGGILLLPELFGLHIVKFGAEQILILLLPIAFLDFLFNASQCFLRTCRQNKNYARSSVVFSLLYSLVPLALSFVFSRYGASMPGAAAGRYIAYAAAVVVAFYMLRTLPAFGERGIKLRFSEKVAAVKYGLSCLIASAFSLIMPYNESIVLSFMVAKSQFSDFQVAQLLPASIQFIAGSVVVFVFPYFAKNYRDGRWIWKNSQKVIWCMTAVMTVIAVLGIVFAPQIVVLFGAHFKTASAIRIMRVFFVTFALNSAVRLPIINILAAIGEVRFNVINAIFSSTVHVAICWAMTSAFGINGAAYGLLTGYIISSVAAVCYLRYFCKKLEYRKPETPTLPEPEEDIEADKEQLM